MLPNQIASVLEKWKISEICDTWQAVRHCKRTWYWLLQEAECQPWPIVKEITFFFSRIWRMHISLLLWAVKRQSQVVKCLNFLGPDVKKMWILWNKMDWAYLLVFLEIWKTNRLKTKWNHFQAETEPRKGPRSSLYPGHPSAPGILSLELESLSDSNANTGSIVTQQRLPCLHCFHPPGASLSLSHWAVTWPLQPGGPHPGWCLRFVLIYCKELTR